MNKEFQELLIVIVYAITIVALVSLCTSPASADTDIKPRGDNVVIGSTSLHSKSGYLRDGVYRKYNQNNLSLGYEAELSTRSYWVTGLYKDSHYGTTYYTGMMWFPGEYGNVRVGVAALVLHSKSYQINSDLKYPIIPVVLPVIEIDAGIVKFNLSYAPKISSSGSHVLGIQVKLPLGELK